MPKNLKTVNSNFTTSHEGRPLLDLHKVPGPLHFAFLIMTGRLMLSTSTSHETGHDVTCCVVVCW